MRVHACTPAILLVSNYRFVILTYYFRRCARAAAVAAAACDCACYCSSGACDHACIVGTCRGVRGARQVQLVLESAELARTSLGGHSAYA